MLPLETLQRVMAASVLSRTSTRLGLELKAGDADPVGRFAIYRNNTLLSLTEALKANFPVTVRLVDERFFAWIAQDFIRRHPPCEARLSAYGAEFPAFIASLPACRPIPYIAEVARLEWAICMSLHAEELVSCSIEALSCLGMEAGAARFRFQPTLQLIPARWPVIDIWTAHQNEGVELPSSIVRKATYAQITRSADRICLTSLPAGRFAFRRGLNRGLSLHTAVHLAVSRDPLLVPAAELASLFAEKIVTEVIPAEGELT